jgi:hypothetical protein
LSAPIITDGGGGAFIDDDLTHVLNGDVGLVSGETYAVEIVPEVPGELIRGWVCPGATATVNGGDKVLTGEETRVNGDGSKISFIRDPATPSAYKIAVRKVSP